MSFIPVFNINGLPPQMVDGLQPQAVVKVNAAQDNEVTSTPIRASALFEEIDSECIVRVFESTHVDLSCASSCVASSYTPHCTLEIDESRTYDPEVMLGSEEAPGDLAILLEQILSEIETMAKSGSVANEGKRAKNIEESKNARVRIGILLKLIRTNTKITHFSTNEEARKAEFGLYCHKLLLALNVCKPGDRTKILMFFSRLVLEAKGERYCKDAWDKTFGEDILPRAMGKKEITVPHVFSAQCSINYRRDLLLKIRIRFLEKLAALPEAQRPGVFQTYKTKALVHYSTDTHFEQCSKVLLDKRLGLGYTKEELKNKESGLAQTISEQIGLWNAAVEEIQKEECTLVKLQSRLRLDYGLMEDQEELKLSLCSIYSELVKRQVAPLHPKHSGIRRLYNRLERVSAEEPMARWKQLVSLRDAFLEIGVRVPVQSEEEITMRLDREVVTLGRRLEGLSKQEGADAEFIKALEVKKLEAEKKQRLWAQFPLERLTFGIEWGYVPSHDQVIEFCKISDADISAKLLKFDLTEEGELSSFACRLLLASSCDLEMLTSASSYQLDMYRAFHERGKECLEEHVSALQGTCKSPKEVFQRVHPTFLSRDQVIAFLNEDPSAFEYAPNWVKEDRDIVLEVLPRCQRMYEHVAPDLREDMYVAKAAVQRCMDKNVVLLVKRDQPDALIFALKEVLEEIEREKEVILEKIAKGVTSLSGHPRGYNADRDIALALVRQKWSNFKYIHEKLQADEEIVLEAIRQNPLAFERVPPTLKHCRKFLLKVLAVTCKVMIAIPEEIKNSKSFALEAIKVNRSVYCHLPPALKKDWQIAKAAVEGNNDIEVLAHAVDQIPSTLQYITDRRVLALLIGTYPKFYSQLRESDKQDRALMAEVVFHNPQVYMNLSDDLQKDQTVATRAAEGAQNKRVSSQGHHRQVAIDPEYMKIAPEYNEKQFHIHLLERCPHVYASLSEDLRRDIDIALPAHLRGIRVHWGVDSDIRKLCSQVRQDIKQAQYYRPVRFDKIEEVKKYFICPDIAIEVVKLCKVKHECYALIPDELKADRNFVLRACKKNPDFYSVISPELKRDPHIVREAFRERFHAMPRELKEDKKFAIAFLNKCQSYSFEDLCVEDKDQYTLRDFVGALSSDLKRDEEFVHVLIAQDVSMIHEVDFSFRSDPQIVLRAIKSNPEIIKYVYFKIDQNFASEAIRNCPGVYEYLPQNLQKNLEIALAAVRGNEWKPTVLLAVANQPLAIEGVHKKFMENTKKGRQVCLAALMRNRETRQWIKPEVLQAIEEEKARIITDLTTDPFMPQGNVITDDPFMQFSADEVILVAEAQPEVHSDTSLASDSDWWDPSTDVFKFHKVASWGYDESYLLDPEVARLAVKDNGALLKKTGLASRSDFDTVLDAVKSYGKAIKHASDDLRAHPEIAEAAVLSDPEAFRFIITKDMDEKTYLRIATHVVKGRPDLFRLVKKELRADKDFATMAVELRGENLFHVEGKLRYGIFSNGDLDSEDEGNLLAIRHSMENSLYDRDLALVAVKQDYTVFYELGGLLADDKDIIRAAVMQDVDVLKKSSYSTRNDQEFMLSIIEEQPEALKYVDFRLSEDENFLVEAMKRSKGRALPFVESRCASDRIDRAAIEEDGEMYCHTREGFQAIRDHAVIAVRSNPSAYYHLSTDFQKDPEIATIVVSSSSSLRLVNKAAKLGEIVLPEEQRIACEVVCGKVTLEASSWPYDPKYLVDRDFILKIVKENGMAIKNVNEKFRLDKDLYLAAAMQNNSVLELVDESIHEEVYSAYFAEVRANFSY